MLENRPGRILNLPEAMSASTIKSFTAVLEPLRNGLGWVIARVPFDVAKAWPMRRGLRVRGEIEGVAIKTTLMTYSGGAGSTHNRRKI